MSNDTVATEMASTDSIDASQGYNPPSSLKEEKDERKRHEDAVKASFDKMKTLSDTVAAVQRCALLAVLGAFVVKSGYSMRAQVMAGEWPAILYVVLAGLGAAVCIYYALKLQFAIVAHFVTVNSKRNRFLQSIILAAITLLIGYVIAVALIQTLSGDKL